MGIMKTLWTLLGAILISASAHANSLAYDFRGDWQSIDFNDKAGLPDYTRFYLKTGRLYLKGNVNDRFSYDLRWGFYKPAVDTVSATGVPSNSKRDGLNSSVEYASITDKMSDMFSLTLGKIYTEIGGFEGVSSGAELYMVSPLYLHQAVTDLDGKNYGVSEPGPKNLLYMTGAKGDFSFDDQHIVLVAVNNISDSFEGTYFNQNRGMTGILWKGGFLDKALTGILSYHTVNPQNGNKDDNHQYLSAGVKYEVSTWVGSLEYNTTTYKDGTSGNKDTLYAAIAKFGYKMDNWTPRLELFTSEEKTETLATNGTNKFMGYGAVLEYKPTPENVRYHVAVNNITSKPFATATRTDGEQTRLEIVLGARMYGDFLK
jgi:phosphate-selective porin O/P